MKKEGKLEISFFSDNHYDVFISQRVESDVEWRSRIFSQINSGDVCGSRVQA